MSLRVDKSIAEKIKILLIGILIVFLLIIARVWVLAIVFHEQKILESKKTQKKGVLERVERATIYDRWGEVLATNRIEYRAGICYGAIRSIPRVKTVMDETGKKTKTFPRKEYIRKLSCLVAEQLQLDADRVEDLMYSKAAVLGSAPYILKQNLSEDKFYTLRMLEKDWPGLVTEIGSQRTYPHERVGSEILGYVGPMSFQEHKKFLEDLQAVRAALTDTPEDQELRMRLKQLEQLTHHLNEMTGKIGIEAVHDGRLRGQHGRRTYCINSKGRVLEEGLDRVPLEEGHPIQLSISIELQEYAEQLLAEYDAQAPISQTTRRSRNSMPEKRPWIKQGAIVVMDPNTGEVLTLASFPRFNSNDFLASGQEDMENKRWKVKQWLETDEYVAGVWDLQIPLIRERWHPSTQTFYEEVTDLDWDVYLDLIITRDTPLREQFHTFSRVRDALVLQELIEEWIALYAPLPLAKVIDLFYCGGEHIPKGVLITLDEREQFARISLEHAEQVAILSARISPYFDPIPSNHDKLLFADLMRLAGDLHCCDPVLRSWYGSQTLFDRHRLNGDFARVEAVLKRGARDVFRSIHFRAWREKEFADFLANKRKEEKAARIKYPKPYLDYLDQEEGRQFDLFWETYRLHLLELFLTGHCTDPSLLPYYEGFRDWSTKEIERHQEGVSWIRSYLALQECLHNVADIHYQAALKTFRPFHALRHPLWGRYPFLRCRNRDVGRTEQDLALGFYPRYGYGYSRSHAFRQATTLGSVFKLVPAYAALLQLYQNGSRGAINPLTMIDDKHHTSKGWNVGFFADGRPIPIFYHGGRLPRTARARVGSIDLAGALEVSSNPYFSLLASEVLSDPEDLCDAARNLGFGSPTGIPLTHEYGGHIPQDVTYNQTGLYSMAIGQHDLLTTPIQTAVMLSALANGGQVLQPILLAKENPVVRWEVPLPKEVKRPLFEGMRRVVSGDRGTARGMGSKFDSELVARVFGKTGTAEVVENYGCDSQSQYIKTKAVWFGSIVQDVHHNPELVIVVYLRQGDNGRFALPLVLKIAKKWETLAALHNEHS